MVTPTPALPSGSFAVQLGVFSNVSNAQELIARLKLAGIPSQLETRVQVGPFANKDEAQRAQDKLRELGLGKGMLVVAGKK
jgi:DedD protein